jgi:hypothetical protein
VRHSRRQCHEPQADEQNTAVDFTDGISGPPSGARSSRSAPIAAGPSRKAIVRYNFVPGDNTEGAEADYCRINQGTRSNGSDTWFEFGTFTFWKGGRIEADNLHDPGTGDADVAFDAIAFVPHNSKVTTACALNDSGT